MAYIKVVGLVLHKGLPVASMTLTGGRAMKAD